MFLLYLSVKNLHLPNNIAAGRQDRPLTSVVIILLKNLNCVNSCAILFIFKTLFKFRKGQTATSTLSLIIYFASFLSCYYLRLLDLELLIPTSQSRSILHSFFFYFKYVENTKSTKSKGKLQKLSVYRIQLEGRAERSPICFSLVTSPNVGISLKTRLLVKPLHCCKISRPYLIPILNN